MTTIATDGKTIAADGLRVWCGEIVQRNARKIIVKPGRAIYAFTGGMPYFGPAVAWWEAGGCIDAIPKDIDDFWTLLIIDKDGIGKVSQQHPYIEHFDPPICLGAGADLAQGVLLAGLPPQQAIEIVAARCNHTGGEIQVVDIAETLRGGCATLASTNGRYRGLDAAE